MQTKRRKQDVPPQDKQPGNVLSLEAMTVVNGMRSRVPSTANLSHILPELRNFAVPIGELVFDPSNVNHHDDMSIKVIAGSHQLYEQHRLLVVNIRNGVPVVIIGNGALQSCRNLGWKYIAATFVEEDHVKSAGRSIADNRTAHFSNFNTDSALTMLKALEAEGVETILFGAGEEYIEALMKLQEESNTNLDEGNDNVRVPDGEVQEDQSESIEAIVIEIHLPPEIATDAITKLKRVISAYEGAILNIA